MMKWKLLILGVLLMPKMVFSEPKVLDRIAAVVNHNIILDSDVGSIIRSVKIQAQKSGKNLPHINILYSQVLEKLIIDRILLQKAEESGIYVNNEQLEEAILSIAKNNRLNITQLHNYVEQQGLNYAAYREQVRQDMIIGAFSNSEVRRRLSIPPQEVDSLATQISLQQRSRVNFNLTSIFLPLPVNSTQEQLSNQKKIIQQLIQNITNGVDLNKIYTLKFNTLQPIQRIDMGWKRIQELPSLFSQSLVLSHKGDIIGPINSGTGCYILKVNDIRGDNNQALVTELYADHILLKPSVMMSNTEAKKKLLYVSMHVNNKRSFNKIGKKFAKEFGSSCDINDLGWISVEKFDLEYRDMLKNLTIGQISQPVHSIFGWHVMRILDIRIIDKSYDMQKEKAYRLLFNRKFYQEMKNWMQDERNSAYVKIST
ncbi:peptidylprolyl isomerase SurA [Candidatus Erwinia haradaeae]|uniref:Chaperone SurA n=1 Tax=Candidatus Erwinia haradaeae TaxID=1922217 RepID=A0A451DIQ8_9GAMM|nr:peptidylprolyl isomerase SurA [Candidatus Erwinia haradaeae]VFP86492.1 Chaperone SurA [Candidatus Erwinia haradaeae]